MADRELFGRALAAHEFAREAMADLHAHIARNHPDWNGLADLEAYSANALSAMSDFLADAKAAEIETATGCSVRALYPRRKAS
ncbi:hypothetical protein [Martelella mediterranea]|uniref:Uncharacterized protein n=1 Tax=Martelella mediterranea TaxID=293089 RepID=A0A4R3NKS7_9HYPH|nr:hypothetical protein [Martelella mediterranea]TCT34619.1 hypothetical protein EDC90_103313 [Martelella mediterranea]